MPNSFRISLPITAAAILLAAPALAQNGGGAPSRADSLFAARAFADAALAYQAEVAADPGDGRAWYQLGHARQQSGDQAGAAEAWRRAAGRGFSAPSAWYNAAAAHAALGDTAAALDALQAAADHRFLGVQLLDADDDFAALRGSARFEDIRLRMERERFPCRFDPVYDQLDFWVGTWDVYLPGNLPAGRNILTEAYGNCTIVEEWADFQGGRGTSLSFWEPALGKWVQRWVGDNGNVVHLEGNLVDGAMVLVGEVTGAAGVVTGYRMTVTPNDDGTVRQVVETSADAGATWQVGFDGLYVPVERSARAAR